jgi:hypothetical protein
MDEQTYQVAGYMYGSFTGDDGKKIPYANLYCLQKMQGDQRSDFKFEGHKVFIFKCTSPEVLKDVKPQDYVQLFFNYKSRVSLISIVNK